MPVPNDLTPEEEAEFGQHGVAPAGQGKEPLSEANDGAQQQPTEHADRQQPTEQTAEHTDRQPRDPATGQFAQKPKEGEETPVEGQQQQPEGEQQPQLVPLAALHESRQRERAALEQARTAITRMNALLMQRQGQGQSQTQQPLPDLTENPVEYIQQLERRVAAFEAAREEEQQYRQLDQSLEQDENMFAMTRPDYQQASDYFVNSRARELLAFYPPEEAQRIMTQEARAIAQQAWQRGMSAGEAIYNMALARGYTYNPQGQGQGDPQQQQGQQPQGQQRGPSAQAQIESIRNGQQVRSLSGGGGGGGRAAVLNAEAILNMTDEEFEEHLGLGKKGANERFMQIG